MTPLVKSMSFLFFSPGGYGMRVSVAESGDLILQSFNLEIMRTKGYYGYIRCI